MRERRIGLDVAARFYFRRIRRIVPMCLTVVCVVLLLSAHLLFYVDVEGVLNEARYALTFTTNVKNFFQERPDDYFKQVFNYQLFLHTWSLGVEMQSYLIAPLLFAFALRLRHGGTVLFFGMLLVTSFLAQVFSRKDVAFGVLFCRIWQFSIGMMGFVLGGPNVKDPLKADKELDGYAIVIENILPRIMLSAYGFTKR
ncbi:Protein OAC-26 [Aphelenchoides avenae]|nr:Protein OAC-26 [Aphelenchus avenae]